jgi:transcriptional regulator with XRE-family HTH domain
MHSGTKAGSRLRAWMQEHGHTQKTFGELVHSHQTNVSAWLHGRVPGVAMALEIERLTGIPVADWTADARPSRPPPSRSPRKSKAA